MQDSLKSQQIWIPFAVHKTGQSRTKAGWILVKNYLILIFFTF